MGACGVFALSKKDPNKQREDEINAKITAAASEENRRASGLIKVLFLGAGESGKSTVFKQMIKLYGKGFSSSELREYVGTIHHNVVSSMIGLLNHYKKLSDEGLPSFFDSKKSSEAYVFAPSEALDWLVSTVSDTFTRLGYNFDSVDVELSKILSSYEESEEVMKDKSFDNENFNEIEEEKKSIEKEKTKNKNIVEDSAVSTSINPICTLLGEPEIESELRNCVENYIKKFCKENCVKKDIHYASNFSSLSENNENSEKDENEEENEKSEKDENGEEHGKEEISNLELNSNNNKDNNDELKENEENMKNSKLSKREDEILRFAETFNFKNVFPSSKLKVFHSRRQKIISSYLSESFIPLSESKIDFEKEIDFLEEKEEEIEFSLSLIQKLRFLWSQPSIRTTFALRGIATTVLDNLRYYIARSSSFFSPSSQNAKISNYNNNNNKFADKKSPHGIGSVEYVWAPSIADVIRSRSRTSGLQSREVLMQGNRFQLIDVGGQRSERRKWLNAFDDVTAVIFVANASGYDQVLFEEENTNRMVEALQLFEQICNMRYFTDQAYILFLNKIDVFREKIKRVPIEETFEEFKSFREKMVKEFEDDNGEKIKVDEETEFEWSAEFFKEKFLEKNTNGRDVYVHFTTATDTSNIIKIFNSVKASIINSSLKQGGLL